MGLIVSCSRVTIRSGGRIMNWILAVLLFISEILMWLGFGRWIFLIFQDKRVMAIVLSVIAVALLLVIWGLLFSPKAAYRISRYPRAFIITLMSVLIGWQLYRMGDRTFGLVLMIATSVIQVLGQIIIYSD